MKAKVNNPEVNSELKLKLIEKSDNVEKYETDSDRSVRFAVAMKYFNEKNNRLVIFKDDEDFMIRMQVATAGLALEHLVNDNDYYVLYEVIRQGYGLNKLQFHEHPYVISAVAATGYNNDLFLSDETAPDIVKIAAIKAKHGINMYGLVENKYGFEVINTDNLI